MEAATEESRSSSRTRNKCVGVTTTNPVRSCQDSRSKLSSVTLDIINSISPGCSKALASAFLEIIHKASNSVTDSSSENVLPTSSTDSLACHLCGCAFYRPVTLPCGHTFCKSCLQRETSKCCPSCGLKLPARLETNVLIKTLLEKWCPAQTTAARLLDEGNRLIKDHPEEALVKFKDALAAAPNNHAVLCSRSHAFYQLNMLQESLSDADLVTRIKPQWSKGYYRRGTALSALGHNEEALISFGICIALDNNVYTVKPDVTRLLQRLFQNNNLSKGLRCSLSLVNNLNSSDCEGNSSEDDDYIQNMKQSQVSKLPVHLLLDRIFYEVEQIKDSEIKTSSNFVLNLNSVEPSDFDCILCCRTLWRPITTPCGHTYCSMCLERCLDYRSTCPLCMTSLIDYLAVHQKQVTEFIERALVITLPSLYAARMLVHTQEVLSLESANDTPVFVCTTAFPSISCPLFVFEPRYRLMIRRCVESGSRQFAMAACVNQNGTNKRFADFGTMLEIKDWVLLADGCSILSTVGVRRFQVMSRGEKDGYDTARVQYISDTPIPAHRYNDVCELHDFVYRKGRRWFNDLSSSLQTEILKTFGRMPIAEPDWVTLSDGPSWTWWLLAILPLGQQLQVGILRTTCLEKRLKVIAKTLDHLVQCQQYPGLSRHKPIKRGEEPTAVETNS